LALGRKTLAIRRGQKLCGISWPAKFRQLRSPLDMFGVLMALAHTIAGLTIEICQVERINLEHCHIMWQLSLKGFPKADALHKTVAE